MKPNLLRAFPVMQAMVFVRLDGGFCGGPAADDLAESAQRARSAVMLLVVTDASGLEIARGTGFLVSADGKLVTNRHVIKAGKAAFAKSRDNRWHRVLGLLAEEPEHGG